ncbi:MAG: FAD-binding protein, partial [Spirochaetales bacterium]|nr:FAD-binding protein [Spirochaetales bacterium]
MGNVNIIGSGMAGLSAAISLSEKGIGCNLISVLPSERAQSVLAEGGINAALNSMGDGDTPALHASDTMEAGVLLADSEAVKGLAETAPAIVRQLAICGVPFNTRDGRLQQRPFGGQTKVRTVFSRSSTGKVVMTALIDKVRYYESAGLVRRFPHHGLSELSVSDGRCTGVWIEDEYTGSETYLAGPVILAFGGMNGLFPGMTTGTTANSGNALAQVFSQGVALSNLEMIQFHPTTIAINDKRCLVSEAARGEGGRLFILRDGKPWYFMEERYPVLKNLMPRDVVSREIYFVTHDESCTGPVYLDMTGLPDEVWRAKLPDLRKEIVEYTKLDPKTEPIPIAPGIHYFMGGIDVDAKHRTNMEGLYAAGECCSQYHGANRLGGNSMLGAMYGGHVAAESCADMLKDC